MTISLDDAAVMAEKLSTYVKDAGAILNVVAPAIEIFSNPVQAVRDIGAEDIASHSMVGLALPPPPPPPPPGSLSNSQMQLLIQQAQASVKAGKGTQVNAQPHQSAAGAEAYLEAIGANASTNSASAWTVAIGLAGQGVVGIGRFGLTFEGGVGAYFSSSGNGVYATLGGACFSGMQVGAAGACGIEITYLWSGGVEIFSGASWTISVQGGDIVGGAVNLIFATPSLVPSGFSVVFPFGEGGSISMQAAKTWTGATS